MRSPASIPLRADTLSRMNLRIRTPGYDRASVREGIVHIGVGGFFRAHQAVYLDDLLHAGDDDMHWGYCGVGLLAHDARIAEVLSAQNCLYTLVERSAEGDHLRVIGSLLNHLHAPADPEAVLEKLASPSTRIVSMTITEGGYYVNEGTGEFNGAHPDVVHDLAHPSTPKCSFGYLAEALDRRKRRGLKPFTLMSCDNVQHNGDVARRMLHAFLEQRDRSLADWLGEHGAFPNSMVDRITPATTDEHRALLANEFGVADGWPVVTEPFLQWVVEDSFPGGRPAWERVGVQMTRDVVPYEKMKMRLLNASHQAMCYIGMLLGYEFAHQTMADEGIRTLVRRLMDEEVSPLISVPAGIDLEAYKQTLIERFSNPAIRDQLERIGTEGSARIPGFVLPSISDAVRRGGSIRLLSFTVAAWFRYLLGTDEEGRAMPMSDPMLETLQDSARRGGPDPSALLGLADLFSPELAGHSTFVREVGKALASFHDKGARATLAEYTDT
ncbi:MAG: mannitol dehydrogenase family protein [Pseudomonadota bacterium]